LGWLSKKEAGIALFTPFAHPDEGCDSTVKTFFTAKAAHLPWYGLSRTVPGKNAKKF